MKIRRDIIKEGNALKQYIYIDLEDEYEFGLDFFKSDGKNSFIYKLKEFVKSIINNIDNDSAILIINGIMVGTLSLSAFLGMYNKKMSSDTQNSFFNNSISQEDIADLNISDNFFVKVSDIEEKNTIPSINEESQQLDIEESTGVDINEYSEKIISAVEEKRNIEKVVENTNNNENFKLGEQNVEKTEHTAENNNSNQENIVIEEEKKQEEIITPIENENKGINVRVNLNGVVQNIELEEYIVGVVAAEMPASFNIEALKAQAVAARTYAMKKTSAGKILSASVSDQAYNTVDEMRNKWGVSFDIYYSKVRDAVYSTKGMVMMYNGNYIDALYHAISSGTTEMPKYVWNSSYPYLVSVDSSLDRNVRGYEVTNFFSYDSLSSKLGIGVNADTNIEVLSYTESGRVNELKIGDSVLSGVTVRSKLSLRSTDFTFSKTDNGVNITTRGYGHGVGMSQYGANEFAKSGMSFSDILTHYYTGIYFSYV